LEYKDTPSIVFLQVAYLDTKNQLQTLVLEVQNFQASFMQRFVKALQNSTLIVHDARMEVVLLHHYGVEIPKLIDT
jgi:hypothetical protein